PRWQERPVLFVVRRADVAASEADLRSHLAGAVAKWWMPEEIIFVETLPMTATGKVRKETLRAEYGALKNAS
ncbi:MAG TPA: long-chain fatty acid--CoA ligase, partial [Polyangiaceae bacterium]